MGEIDKIINRREGAWSTLLGFVKNCGDRTSRKSYARLMMTQRFRYDAYGANAQDRVKFGKFGKANSKRG